MKILVVEDNRTLGSTLKTALEESGWAVDLATNGTEGLFFAENSKYDIIALDWMLPELSGLDILQAIRSKSIDSPVIMMTAKGALHDKLQGLGQGADDYIVKPFELAEFLARLQAIVRRSMGKGNPKIRVGKLTLDLGCQKFVSDQGELDLTAKEYDLLRVLVSNQGLLVERRTLLAMIYHFNDEPESNSLDVLMGRIRKKIAGYGIEINTVRGKGFLLRVA